MATTDCDGVGVEEASDVARGAFFRFCRWHGYEWGDRIAVFWRPVSLQDHRRWSHRYLGRLKERIVPNVKYYDASRLGDLDLARAADDLVKNPPSVLRGYPSALARLAEFCEDHSVTITATFVTTTGELLSAWQREKLNRQFCCSVVDQYGCTEIMGGAFECGHVHGLHITDEHCIVEVVDGDGNIVPAGAKGMLILTDLDNYRMPFIAYLVGDEGWIEEGACSCGRRLARLGGLEGRACDIVRGVNGTEAHGLFFVTLLQDAAWFERFNVRDFEVVQRRENRFDIRLVCGRQPSVEDQQRFAALCRGHFGEMELDLEFVDEIPRNTAAKRRHARYEVC